MRQRVTVEHATSARSMDGCKVHVGKVLASVIRDSAHLDIAHDNAELVHCYRFDTPVSVAPAT